jgi:uncharacterized protein YeaO (DUF488 family)
MAIRIVSLDRPRAAGEGLRVGAVRRNPGTDAAADTAYDVWLPTLAPSMETLRLAQEAKTEAQRAAFARKYRAEMARPDSAQSIALLAALSHDADLVIGCYCEDRFPCHLPVLRDLLVEKGACFADAPAAVSARPAPWLAVDNAPAEGAAVVLPFPVRIEATPAGVASTGA